MKIKEVIQTESCLVFLFRVHSAKEGRNLNIHKRNERTYSFCFPSFLHVTFNKGEMSLCRGHGSGTGKGGCGGRAVNLPGWGEKAGWGWGRVCVYFQGRKRNNLLRFWRS